MTVFQKKVRPAESTAFFLNPHKGFATFQRFEGDPLYEEEGYSEEGPTEFPERTFEVAPDYLPTTVSYCRWFWRLVEPEEGRYDFSVVERSLETAQARGQTLHARLMPAGALLQPWAPDWYLNKYPVQESRRWGDPYPMPVWDSPAYADLWEQLILAFGERFDCHPSLDCVDMSFIGDWGEGDGNCSDEVIDRLTAAYARAHPRAQRIAMIGGYKMTAGVRSGAGWRCDSSDDLGFWPDSNLPFDRQWNHLYDFYPEAVIACGAQRAWETAPVVFEPGIVLATSERMGFDLDFIVQQNLKYHGSVFSAKSNPLPAAWMDTLRRFANDLGYRFVLRQARYDAEAKLGASFGFSAWIENVGVAPLYRRDYRFAVRLEQEGRVAVHRVASDLTKWLPGDAWITESIPVPTGFRAGNARVSCGIVGLKDDRPAIRFASENADPDGWMPLETIELR